MNAHELDARFPRAEHHDGASSLRLWQPDPQVVVTKIRGHMSTILAAALIRESEASGPRYYSFLDCWDVESYDILSQRDLTVWSARSRKRFIEVHLLTPSVLLRVGVSAANLALGGLIQLTAEPAAFYASLTSALARKGRNA